MIHKLRKKLKRALCRPKKTFDTKPKVELLERIDEPFRSALLSLYAGDAQRGFDGEYHDIDQITKISPKQGMWLYDFYIDNKPESSLEIGMAYGFSTLFFLAASAKNLKGKHTAVDPFQKSYWNGIGLTLANQHSGKNSDKRTFRFIEELSVHAATDLAREKQYFDLVFIDGNHRYDDVLVDFYLCAQITSLGGHIIFDDMWMCSVKTVVDYIRSNRPDFKEVFSSCSNICVFQKIGEDCRRWDEFTEFKVHASTVAGK